MERAEPDLHPTPFPPPLFRESRPPLEQPLSRREIRDWLPSGSPDVCKTEKSFEA